MGLSRQRLLRFLIEWTVIAAILGGLYLVVAMDLSRDPSRRSPVSRVKADMRSLATAIESYYVDWNVYPPTMPLAKACNYLQAGLAAGGEHMTTFAWGPGTGGGLTTPVAFMTGYAREPFFPSNSPPFAYFARSEGWIMVSTGPDKDYDLDPARDYDPTLGASTYPILTRTYDSTNGTVSNGDVWRMKE